MSFLLRSGTRPQVREMIQGTRDDAAHLGMRRIVREAEEALDDLDSGHQSVMVGVQGFRVTPDPA